MMIIGPYPPDAGLISESEGNAGSAGQEIMLSFIVSEDGDTGKTLPGNAHVRYCLVRGEESQSPVVGIGANEGLFYAAEDFEVNATEAATNAPNVWLKNDEKILVSGIQGVTRIVLIYKLIPLLYA